MRIAWVTPLSQRSAIGRVSAAACRMLAEQGHDLTIVRSEHRQSASESAHETSLPVHWWHDTEPEELARTSDAIVLNIGDNFGFHAGIFRYLPAEPCLGIFHDFFLYSLFNDWLAQQPNADQLHNWIIRTHYGDGVSDLAENARRGEVSLAEIADKFPMTEWIGAQCGAAIVHAEFYRRRVEVVPGPVRTLKLSQEPRNVDPLPPRADDGEVVILTVGVINPNKRADLILEAIGSSSRLRSRCRYCLVGIIAESQREHLTNLAARIGFERLDILGEVADKTLERELERADIICCLRNPVLEGASASAIEAMMCGRPVVVSDAGFYRELPNDCVVKVPLDVGVGQLASVLETLVDSEPRRRQIGNHARHWARKAFTTRGYVAELTACLDEFVQCKPYLHVARSLGSELALLDLEPSDPAIGHVADCMHQLFLEDVQVATEGLDDK
jgi:glycosyltransferase involved in cell wall biosynthesis